MLDSLVSIITPAYCCAGVVGEMIQSVLDQTYEDWELLIVDDCSRDDTVAVIESYCNDDPRISLICHHSNGGPAKSRNTAIKLSRGRWLAFLDSDDLWLPSKLEISLDYSRKSGASFVYTGFRRISADGAQTGRYLAVPNRLTYRNLLCNTAIATSTVLIDRSSVPDVFMRDTYYDDFDCWLRILKAGIVAHGINADLMRYRVSPNSISRKKCNSARMVWRAYRQLEGMGIISSSFCFAQYAVRGVFKYSRL